MTELTEFVTNLLSDMDTANVISLCLEKIPNPMLLMMTVIVVVGFVGAVLRLIFDAL